MCIYSPCYCIDKPFASLCEEDAASITRSGRVAELAQREYDDTAIARQESFLLRACIIIDILTYALGLWVDVRSVLASG